MSREGKTSAVSKEVKDQILSLFIKNTLVKVEENEYSALVYSQFYRVCSNKWGMGCANLKDKLQNQQAHYREIDNAIALLAKSPHQFLFGDSSPNLPEYVPSKAVPSAAPDEKSFKNAVESYLLQQLKACLTTIIAEKEDRQKQLRAQINQIKYNQSTDPAYLIQLKQKWNKILTEALDISALTQISNDIRECADKVKAFRKKLAEATITVHGNEVIQACLKQKGEK